VNEDARARGRRRARHDSCHCLNVEKRYGALQALAGVSLVVVAVSLLLLSGICLRILRSGYKLRQ